MEADTKDQLSLLLDKRAKMWKILSVCYNYFTTIYRQMFVAKKELMW